MKRFISKKVLAIGLAVGVTLGAGGAAFAYFTSSATGTGSATAGSATALTDITQTNTISGLTPGSAAASVVYKIVNPSGNGDQSFGVVSISNVAVTLAGAGLAANGANANLTCDASDFTVTAGTTPVGTIGDGATFTSGTPSTNEPTIQMKDETGTDQDACQDATLVLTLSAAQGS